jgi:hypothetical protein
MTVPTRSISAATERSVMPQITDAYMNEMLGQSKTYTAMLLRVTEKASQPDSGHVVWEHGRRNFALRREGTLPIICPATDDTDWAGIGIFNASPEEVDRIMQEDPGVKAGLFTYELHPVLGFPASALP